MKLVYFSPVPWDSFSQRPHKFVEWFQRKFDATVLWIDPYPTRLPVLGDYRRLKHAKPTYLKHERFSWLTVLQPLAFPIEPLPFSTAINRILWKKTLKGILAFSDERTYLAVGKPSKMAILAAKLLPTKLSLYDGMDDFPAFYSGWSRRAMLKREAWLIKKATFVITSSSLLQQRWLQRRPDVQLVLNGLDIGVMPPPRHSRQPGRRRVFGYVGTVSSWFDWEWVIHLCLVRKQDIVRVIGPKLQPIPSALPENLEILPACSHQEAIKAMLEFDVGLIPFRRTDLTAAVDPIKYYEYRALGIPVVSTSFGEMAHRKGQDGTYITQDLGDVVGALECALSFQENNDAIEDFRAHVDWSARFEGAVLL